MKIAVVLTLMSSQAIFCQDFISPSQKDLMAINLNLLEEAREVMSNPIEKDCDPSMSATAFVDKIIKRQDEVNEIFCVCGINNGKKENSDALYSLIGAYKQELTVFTGNDNFFHGVLQVDSKTAALDGDDRGRTFSGGVDYRLIGSEGQVRLTINSDGFGKLTTKDRYSMSAAGERYLNFREVNTLNVRVDKNLSKNDEGKLYFISEAQVTSETDKGYYSREIQQWWHKAAKDMLQTDFIQYKYLTEEKDQDTLTGIVGLGREWFSNIGNWKCQTRLEAKGGMSINLQEKMTPELAVRAENKLSHSSLPWVALSSWIQASAGFAGPSRHGGLVLSMEKTYKNLTIVPFIGIERHFTKKDKAFGSPGSNPYENYHVLGVTIKY